MTTSYTRVGGMAADLTPGFEKRCKEWLNALPAKIDDYEALLTKNCARCHAIGRTGTSSHAEAPPFRTLSKKYPIEGLAESLAEGLFTGHPDMPEFKFEADEVGAILDYLTSIQDR